MLNHLRSANYAPEGAMLLAKVLLGKPYTVNAFAEVKSCPKGYDSVRTIIGHVFSQLKACRLFLIDFMGD